VALSRTVTRSVPTVLGLSARTSFRSMSSRAPCCGGAQRESVRQRALVHDLEHHHAALRGARRDDEVELGRLTGRDGDVRACRVPLGSGRRASTPLHSAACLGATGFAHPRA
jgi:hypothetical protein